MSDLRRYERDPHVEAAGVGLGPGDGSRAVAIGGGHGLNRSLAALTHVVDHVTAVVTVADDGGSSGRLRRDLGVVPPGDMRMAMAALSPRQELVDILQFRFDRGELDGHSLGNLIMIAAADLAGDDLVEGLDRIGGVLGIRGRVLPCTTTPLDLCAQVAGIEIRGQVRIARTRGVEQVSIDPPDAVAAPQAVEAIRRADLIVLGPGSLYTSIIPNLLVPGIAEAIAASDAPVAYVANLREQVGETEGMTLEDHLDALHRHAVGVEVTALVGHQGDRPRGEGAPLEIRPEELRLRVKDVVCGDLLDGEDGHDPLKLADLLEQLLRGS